MKQIALRVIPEFAAAIKRAARLNNQGEAEFMRGAITAKVNAVIGNAVLEGRERAKRKKDGKR